MERLDFHLDQFEGPLDLLLTLIQKHKLDIYDIAILELVDQYMEAMGQVKEDTMEAASSFMEMAARLVYIKSVMLLPRHEEEAEELKSELQEQLIEYQLVQELAKNLGDRYIGGETFVREPMKIEEDRPYFVIHHMENLLEAYILVLGKKKSRLPPPKSMFSGIVSKRIVSVESREIFVLEKLYREEFTSFDSFFMESTDASEKVATFLAMLELVKNKRIFVSDDDQMVWLLSGILGMEGGEPYESQ